MPRTLQFKRYGSATLANTIGANGELIINSTNQTLTVHDGVTPGGFTLLNEAIEIDIDQYARNTANTTSNNISIIQGVNTTQNTNITNVTDLAQAAFTKANNALANTNTLTANNLTVTGLFTVDGVVLQWHTPIPLTSKGDPGDRAGFIAIDDDKLYRCVENYTNGANNIWRFVNFTGGTWG
jgi:hypothetical protein